MSRLPIRAKLTAAFVLATAAVFAGAGLLLYAHLRTSLDRALDQGLRARAADVTALVQQADTGLSQAHRPAAGGVAQVLTFDGRVFDETPGLGHRPLLSAAELARAQTAGVIVPRTRENTRLFALPVRGQGQRLVVVVGASLHERDQALGALRSELLIAGPLALIAVGLIGYLVAAGALRPVERIRRHADAISDRDLSERLPVPRARDELARLGTTLNDMLTRIERGVRRERGLIADAAHELRSPLSLLRAEVELALEGHRSTDELLAALRSVGEEADRLSQLAEDLLLLARIDEGELPLREQTVHLPELLESVAARFARRAADAGRHIAVEAEDISIEADRLRLEQALGNLVQNALRHGAGAIRIHTRLRGESIELHVADEGPGIPSEFAAVAFERFTRADEARSGAGSGLGLAIVKAIAEAHVGTVGLEPEAAGADVYLSLPSIARSAVRSDDDADANGRARVPTRFHRQRWPIFWRPLTGPHLAAGSDPSVLPGPVLIADRSNDRLLVVDPQAGSSGSSHDPATCARDRPAASPTTPSSPPTASRSSPPRKTTSS